MSVTLNRDVLAAIRAHGAETYPNECCGALIGADGVVEEAFALPNTTEEGPRRRFLVRPRTIAAPSRGRRSRAANCSGSITRIPIIPRSPRSTTSIMRGRFFPM